MSVPFDNAEFAANLAAAQELVAKQEGTESNGENPSEEPSEESKASTKADKAEGKPEGGKGNGEGLLEDPNAEPAEVSSDRKRARLEAIAKELGYKVEGDKVEVNDRAEFREYRRKQREQLKADREAFENELKSKRGELDTEGQTFRSLKDAVEAGDADAVAKLLGHDSFTKLGEHFLIAKASPQSRELAAVKKQLAEREAREKTAAEERAKAEAQSKHEAEVKAYMQELRGEVEDLDDPAFAKLAKDSQFLDQVLFHQRAHYDGSTTITAKEAANLALADARKAYDNLHSIFGPQKSKAEEDDEDEAPAPKKGTKPSGRSSGAESKPIDPVKDDAEWFKYAERELKKAQRAASR